MVVESTDRNGQNRRVSTQDWLDQIEQDEVWNVAMSQGDRQHHQHQGSREEAEDSPATVPALFKNESINENTVFVNPASLQRVNPPHSRGGGSITAARQQLTAVRQQPTAARASLPGAVQHPPSISVAGPSSSAPGTSSMYTTTSSGSFQQQQTGSSGAFQEPPISTSVQGIAAASRGVKRLSSAEDSNVYIDESSSGVMYYAEERESKLDFGDEGISDNSNGSSSFSYGGGGGGAGAENSSTIKQITMEDLGFLNPEQLVQQLAHSSQIPIDGKYIKGYSEPSPSGLDISLKDYPGNENFEVRFSKQSSKSKHWDYSSKLNKLFIDMNKWVQVEFRIGRSPPPAMFIRTVPVYAEASSRREPVKRCPNHASMDDPTNKDFPHPLHVVRYEDSSTQYCEDVESGRLFSLLEVCTPHQGTDSISRNIKFMCLGSDVGGINRRPIKLVFTLENAQGHVEGRRVIDVRICSCPRRDLQQEEHKHDQQMSEVNRITNKLTNIEVPAESLNSRTVVYQPPPGKKKKMDKEQIFMVPVHHEDFKKINEFAESAWVCRDPENASTIRETRRQLIKQHNSENIKRAQKKS